MKTLSVIQSVIAREFAPALPGSFTSTAIYREKLRNVINNDVFPAVDSNHDNMLDSNEFHRLFVALLVGDEITSVCEDDYLRFCDGDTDGIVIKEELELCIGVTPCECVIKPCM